MVLQSILLVLLALLLTVIASWSLSTFLRLSKASAKHSTEKEFDSQCNLTKKYVATGKVIGIILVVLSIISLIVSSINLYLVF